ncbi:peptide chain release factor 2 [bacterium]|nr:peptide chain release factor 2 [bacterium]
MSLPSACARSGGVFDVDTKKRRVEEIEAASAQESFWVDAGRAKVTLQEKSALETVLQGLFDVERRLSDAEVLTEMVAEEPSDSNLLDLQTEIKAAADLLRGMELQEMLSGPNDKADAIVSINSGAGGTESQDWAQILFRMYLRYCEQRGFQTQVVDQQDGEEAGIKSATFMARGQFAFGFLSAEIGVHRLVRISPFDSNARRHTSFASVFVYPDIEQDIEIKIDEKDLRIDTYRAGGAGGQKVNKTDSAVRITHGPSGIVVQCQNERSQHQNKAMAMKILKARLYERELEMKRQQAAVVEDSKKDIAWGSQIRSYVLHPYRMIKDHRTDFETADVMPVLDGALQGFVESYLMSRVAPKKEN